MPLVILVLMMYCGLNPLLAQHQPDPLTTRWVKTPIQSQSGFRGLSIAPTGTIWVSGTNNAVFKSVDHGQSWLSCGPTLTESSLDFRDIFALDDLRAWIMAAGSGNKSAIYRTLDGGLTWKPEHLNTLSNAFFDGLHFWTDSKAVTYGDPVNNEFFLLFYNGSEWAQNPKVQMPPSIKNEASFAASGTGIVGLNNHLWMGSGGGSTARVFHSSDHGMSWEVQTTPIRANASSSGIFSLAFRDASVGVCVGGKFDEPNINTDSAAFTTDGGKTWTRSKVLPSGFRSCVEFLPTKSNTLVAVGTNGGDISVDDGVTWKPIKDTPSLNVLKFSHEGIGWGAGPQGEVYQLMIK